MSRRTRSAFVATLAATLVTASANAGSGVRLSLVGPALHPVAGQAVSVVVRASRAGKPLRRAGVLVWIARGNVQRSFTARPQSAGRYRARVVFPSSGRWSLGARVDRTQVKFGAVGVRRRPVPLIFVWPTSVAVESARSLLVVEDGAGRVMRVDPLTGKTAAVIPSISRPYSVALAGSGSFYLAAGKSLLRVDSAGHQMLVAEADADIGPIAVAPNGDVYFTTETRVFKLAGGVGPPTSIAGTGVAGYGGDGGPATAAQISGPHGLAVTSDGAVFVSDTANGRVRRIDLRTGLIETWAQFGSPRGLVIAPDGTVYLVDGSTGRVMHLMIDGRLLGSVRRVFRDPYDVKAGDDGSLYVVDTSVSGWVYRVAPDGSSAVISRH
jgi:hypothetical protein